MRTTLLALLFSAVAVLMPSSASAWGFAGHQLIVRRAIALLPPELKPFYEHHLAEVEARITDPDLWRSVGSDDDPNHFVDFGVPEYGPPPFLRLPREHGAALAKFGSVVLKKYGTLPWREEEMAGGLRRAFEGMGKKSAFAISDVTLLTGFAAHYLQDAHQPFHATDNYDGQKTGNLDVHARFETELIQRFESRLQLKPALPGAMPSARDAAFDALIVSYGDVEKILAADNLARTGKDVYDDDFFERFFVAARPVLEERLSSAITATASLIITAWEQAGKPVMFTEMPRTPRPVQR